MIGRNINVNESSCIQHSEVKLNHQNLPEMLETACRAGDPGLIPGIGKSLGQGNGHPLQTEGEMVGWHH